jgi:hypothetical protein
MTMRLSQTIARFVQQMLIDRKIVGVMIFNSIGWSPKTE